MNPSTSREIKAQPRPGGGRLTVLLYEGHVQIQLLVGVGGGQAAGQRSARKGESCRPGRGQLARQAQNDRERAINIVQLIARQKTVGRAQATRVYGAKLFHQHSGLHTFDFHFRSEGGR